MASLLNMSGGSLLEKGLPYDAEVEYLQSTGTQWIDTGLAVRQGQSISVLMELEFTELNTNDNNIICGVYRANNVFRLFSFVGSDKKWKTSYVNVQASNVTANVDTNYQIDWYFRNGLQQLTVNNSLIINQTNASSNWPNISFSIFGAHYGSGIISSSLMKLKRYKMTLNNETTLVDMIPVRIGTTGYLYDKVSGQLFGNAGTGDFILGNDI